MKIKIQQNNGKVKEIDNIENFSYFHKNNNLVVYERNDYKVISDVQEFFVME